jgi:RimJ/RimL family protein N-acetyltransferase
VALTRLAFLDATIDHVEIHCDRRNTASSRVPERLGYRIVETNSADAAAELLVWRLSRADYVERVSNGQLE